MNFRPTDLEFAPDGSLYVVDWQNALIGHMQHNARDPNRDHSHGRIYRVTYPSRPLVKPAKIHGASIPELLKNLELPELRTRYRTRRELRGHNPDNVAKAAAEWSKDKSERLKLEALWVTWGAGKVNTDITRELLKSSDHRIRSAAINVLRFNINSFKDHEELLVNAANDSHGRVRMSALVASTYMYRKMGTKILQIALDIHRNLKSEIEAKIKANAENPKEAAVEVPVNEMYNETYVYAREVINRQPATSELKERTVAAPPHLDKKYAKLYIQGSEVYAREGHCITCHQGNGKGLPDSGFPPLAETKWVTGNSDRLIKLTLKGLMGPIEVLGKKYPGQVPMTPFEHMLNDQEIASVLTYVRNSFGNKASAVEPAQVSKIRSEVKSFVGLYSPDALLKEHPLK